MAGPILTLLAVAGYGVLHSVLASRWAKRRARQTLGPAADRFYRLIYNLVGGATLLPVLAVVGLEPGELLYRLPLPWSAIALVGQALAALVIVLGLLQTDLRHFLGLRQMIRGDEGPPSSLVVTGLYRWVRHPLYSAGLVFLWLTPLMTTSMLAFNFGFTLYILIGSAFEERRLMEEFGQAYADYRRRVPRLIPRFGRWTVDG
ncbi:MAG TPA: isoprenylcysteine carboxylmethyltransferase family protein [Anaerolineales bacterium]|nr:isoprenylcysteine carboxylmethyltransferase family protein [Anaerolineales bacterium]